MADTALAVKDNRSKLFERAMSRHGYAADALIEVLHTAQELFEGMLNRVEAAIRCFDPRLSCSTHALGQMAMVVEVHGPGGELLARKER